MSHSIPADIQRYTLNMGAVRRTTPITDSPWFWACLFASVGAMMLLGFSTKFSSRQAQIERTFQARQLSGQSVSHPATPDTPITHDNTIISLRPILALLGFVAVIAWPLVWWQLRRLPWQRNGSEPIDSK